MLHVKIEKILPVTEARDSFNKLIDEVESSDELYVLTKNGKPAAVLVGVHHLEKLTGTSEEDLMDQTNTAVPSIDDSSVITTDNASATPAPADTASAMPEAPAETPVEAPAIEPTVESPISEVSETAQETAPVTPLESVANTYSTTPAPEANQQSGATANPFESSAAPTETAPAEDPMDFLSDSDADPIPATPEAPVDNTMAAPAEMPAQEAADTQAPAATGPTPMTTPETPVNTTTPPTQPSA